MHLALSKPDVFLQNVLPELIPNAPAFTSVVASRHRIGLFAPKSQTEIRRRNGLTSISFHHLTMEGISTEAIPVLTRETDPTEPILATVYAGKNCFLESLHLVVAIREARPNVQVVILACECISPEQEAIVLRGLEERKIRHAAWCLCGGSKHTADVRRAVKNNWTPVHTDVQPPPSADSADLGA